MLHGTYSIGIILKIICDLFSDTINKAIYVLWITPSAWHEKKKLSLNDGATLSEADWKVICRAAKARCEELGGDFVDPTSTTSFGPKS